MTPPTIGRRVWFRPNARSSTFAAIDQKQAMDAGVIFVHDDRKVNLFVTDHYGGTHFVPEVPLLQDSDQPPKEGHYAEWMPYQKSVAAEAAKGFNSEAGKAGAPPAPLNK